MKRRRGYCLCLLLLLSGCGMGETAVVSGPAEIPAEPRYVALTFDDGPWIYTARLLDGLRERGANATFFLIGEQIEGREDLLKRMQAEGHQVGNHTWDHVCLQGRARSTVEDEVGRTDRMLRQILDEGNYWVRPPYGLLNENQYAWISEPMVHWSLDTEDWKLRNADKVYQRVISQVKPGDIILMHDFYSSSVDAALRIVDTLEEQGYVFVTVEELLTIQGIQPQAGTFYSAS